MAENLDLNSDFTSEQYRAGDDTFISSTAPSGTSITSLNGLSGPSVVLDGGTSGFSFSTAAPNVALASPLTTKGDIYTRSSAVGTRLGVGSNGQVLTADSAQATGLKWATPSAASGDVSGPSSSVDLELALFDGMTGKLIKRASVTGLLKAASGVLSAAVAGTDYQAADQDLIDIAGLSPSNDDFLQRKAGAWANRTPTQVRTDLAMGGFAGWTDGTTRTVAASSTQYTYLLATTTGAFNNTESNRQNVVPQAGTLSRLYIRTSGAQPGDAGVAFTVRVNGVDTGITVSVGAGAAAGTFSDTTHSATVAAGDLVSLKAVNSSASASAGVFEVRLVFARS